VDSNSTYNVHEDILVVEGIVGFSEYSDQHGKPTAINAQGGSSCRTREARGDERLNLEEQRAASLKGGGHDGPRSITWSVGNQCSGGLRHLLETFARHLEECELASRAKAVFFGPQDAKRRVCVSFEVDNGVDRVLQSPGAGELAALGDMAYEEHGASGCLCVEDEPGGDLPNLADSAGRPAQFRDKGGLHGVNDEDIGLDLLCTFEGSQKVGFRLEKEQVFGLAQTEAAGAHLGHTLFP
jgi:hypothetical protein